MIRLVDGFRGDDNEKVIDYLKLNQLEIRHQTISGVALQNTNPVKEKLLQELMVLEKQMEVVEAKTNTVDFSMMQTYKEMIYSRCVFFNELNH